MRSYYFLASERINSLYNQLATSTPVEITTKRSNKKVTHIEGKLGAEGGLLGFFKETGGVSGSKNKENSFEENIRSHIELEHKLGVIEKIYPLLAWKKLCLKIKLPLISQFTSTEHFIQKV